MKGLNFRRWATTVSIGVALAGAATFVPGAAQAGGSGWRHDDLDVRVSVGVDAVAATSIHAERFTPTRPAKGVQILVPGATYDHRYFDLETSRGVVSQARQAARDGWVAIAIDRVGTGGSSKPPAASVTTAVHVASIDQFVDRIDRTYKRLPIVLVGHSYGSVVAAGVAAQSDDVDALVITGFLYRRTAPSFEGFPELVPAGRKLPEGYLTTAPNTRQFFYHLPNTAPATLAADERTKATTTEAEVPGFAQELFTQSFASAVRVPVLVVVGEHDYLFKGSDPAEFALVQRQTFAAAVSVDAVLIRDAGHDLALQRNAPHTNAIINRWALEHARSAVSPAR
ncbi:alpha/beta fold hydrolase [Solwaraspora sp. WMMA2056]|uniref:alpha/beta hydrolase n=1 Tax=Solwaraspora sp. WMMA2056 TaxID=3015161 RepID=UPI00259B5B0A|nr:alpha/beta hydrolase [Solwaraspora sp. WMMA2056]WJK40846.1 alpha/beta fold hydrolase [Solwaraspora sp. WMMA2056]